ncbi:hypothetical protein GHT06_017312 [Daphnia sinensis]|uniref:Fibrillin-2 n=1 Tax=Daphnia sinensis TaxID=1820382 RepID=A0AAD5KQM9_9CRUS|nr:hypothetical protein GHT06_017312 [Daphnia sinensis]
MAGRSSGVARSILIVYLFLLSTGHPVESKAGNSTKEHSRIRQLSGNQYQSQYGIVRPENSSNHRTNSTVSRHLFAWSDMAVQSSDKLPAATLAPSSNAETAAIHRRKKANVPQRKQLQLRQKKPQQMKRNGRKVGRSNLKSASSLKKSLDNEEEEEKEDEEEEEGDEEGDEEEEEEGEEEEEEEGGEEEGEESDVEEDNEDPDAEEDDETNPRISKPTTTTTTPLIPTASAEVGQDFIDRSSESNGADNRREAEGNATTSSVSRETDDKDDEDTERPPAHRMDVAEHKAAQEKKDDVRVDLISGSLDGDVSPSHANQTDVGNAEKSEDETAKGDQSENENIELSPAPSRGFDNEIDSRANEGRKDADVNLSNVIVEEKLEPVQPSKIESSSSEDEHEEANEIRAQVQPEIKSTSNADDGSNDIQVDSSERAVKGGRDGSFGAEEDDSEEDETNFLPMGHSSGTNQNKPASNEPSAGSPITDSGVAGSGDEEDETNDILPDRLASNVPDDASKTSVSSVKELAEAEEEEEDAVDNEIETIVPSESFSQPDHNRFLHGQIDLNPAVLDTSCGPFTSLPVIPNAVVAKYGRTRWPSPPFNLLAEVIFECQDTDVYQLDPTLPDRLFCSNQQWIGQHPKCVTINRQQQPHFAVTDGASGNDEEKGLVIPLTSSISSNAVNVSSTAGQQINERSCSNEDRGGCEHVCSQSAEPDSIRCLCYRGFRLNADGKSCVDIDECETGNGGCDDKCSNLPGSYICSCPVGFRLASNGKKCIDVNECSLRNGHGPCQGACHNTHGSYHCSCEDMPGTQLAADGHLCEDIDECRTDNGGCSHSCLNTLGTAYCACPEGYMLADDWKTCDDIDECDYSSDDDDSDRLCPGICRNTIGSYVCVDPDEEPVVCPPGYDDEDEDGHCHDIDECSSSNGGCSHICINNEGSHRCECPSGLFIEADNKTCKDIDECASDNGGCSHTCVNMPSSYKCTCPEGYTLGEDWTTCQDIDECAESGLAMCGIVGTCFNIIGSYRCLCPSGYKEKDMGCEDIDECLMDPCGSGKCINELGSYTCMCHEGFRFDNKTCQDIDECKENVPCLDGICENTVGSFTCSCKPGYYLENNTCFDVDECVNSPCIDGTCINQPGSYLCLCEPGFTLERNVCIDFDECLISPCINATCVNQIGSYRCDCPDGYLSRNNTCFDVDECQSNPCVNGQCVNTEGSYWCRCLDGFKALGNICLDIDECETAPCVNGECINTQGSYQCECHPGFYLEDDSCFDVDECQANPCANGTCVNLLGSYQCNCPPGHILVDSRVCLDVNECATNNGQCDQKCINTPGSYYCSCDKGFYLDPEDKRQCLDVDECDINNGGCSQVCLNRPGNFSCECRTGYVLSNDKSSCLEIVSAVTHYCPAIEPPPGGYLHCSSRPGIEGYKPGSTCTLRCRKGYAFRRHKPQLTWQANQVFNKPALLLEEKSNMLSGRQSNAGLAMLQGWKATQVRSGTTKEDWQSANRTHPEDALKKVKGKNHGKKTENDKRQVVVNAPVQAGLQRRGRQRPDQGERVKRQLHGRREFPDQPFRRCGDDGKWKGKLGFCQALTCPPLTKPANGSVSPLSCATGDAAPNQLCYFTCETGFRVTGNPVRTCLPSLKWNPLRPPPVCEKASAKGNKQAKRPRLDADVTVPNKTKTASAATYETPTELDWSQKPKKHNQPNPTTTTTTQRTKESPSQPKFEFGINYKQPPPLFGVPRVELSPSKVVDRNYFQLASVHPWPRIECPKDMTIDLPTGKRSTEVLIPQPATNVDYVSHVEAEPSWAKKLRAELGPIRMVISFRARNPATEYTAICSFVLEVRDREAPTVKNCPHDIHVRLSSLEPYANAPWTEPVFNDNIAVTHVIKSKEPNSLFALGEHVVSYTASDAAGNTARCQFTVHVSPALIPAEFNRSESCVRLESPPNGDLNCLSWTWGQMCRPSCSAGHVFFRPLPSAVYLCGRDRRWKPGTSVPDCAPTSIIPEGGCPVGWEERRTGGMQCVGCAPGLHRPLNSTVCIPCPMGTYQDNFSAGSCKSCPKKLTTCAMAARQCTDCKPPEECSASSQRNYSGAGGDVISPTPTLSKLPANQRRRQQLHQRQMRLRQQRHRHNNSSTTTNVRRV